MHTSRRRNQSILTKALDILASDLGIVTITILTILCIYLLDTMTPLGEPVWLLYLIPLALSYWSSRYYAIPAVCIAITLFLIAGFFLSPQGIAVNYAILMRFTFFLIFFIAAILLWWVRRRQITEERL
jgi:K+-sensing histidine kinase KdpD